MLEMIERNGWETWKVLLALATFWHLFWVVFTNLSMWAIYYLEIPFFERYKINSR